MLREAPRRRAVLAALNAQRVSILLDGPVDTLQDGVGFENHEFPPRATAHNRSVPPARFLEASGVRRLVRASKSVRHAPQSVPEDLQQDLCTPQSGTAADPVVGGLLSGATVPMGR